MRTIVQGEWPLERWRIDSAQSKCLLMKASNACCIFQDLALTDDVVLNQIQFESGEEPSQTPIQMSIIEQLTLLLFMCVVHFLTRRWVTSLHSSFRNDRQINNPRHEITTEEQLAFLTVSTAKPNIGSVEDYWRIVRVYSVLESHRCTMSIETARPTIVSSPSSPSLHRAKVVAVPGRRPIFTRSSNWRKRQRIVPVVR